MKKLIGRILIIAGILMILGAGSLTAYNLYEGDAAGKTAAAVMTELETAIRDNSAKTVAAAGTSDTAVADTAVADTGEKADSEKADYEVFPEISMPTVEIEGNRYVGTLEIPSADLELPIQNICTDASLKVSPGVYSGSVYTNDMIIGGHSFVQIFTPIRHMDMGSTVIFTDVDGNRFEYVASWVELIDPSRGDLLMADSENWDLTLFTCSWGSSDRYVVRCTRVK